MNEACGKYAGMDRYEARKAIVKDLEEQGYLVKIEELHPQRRHLLPLRHHRRADGLQAVVCQDGAAGKAGHRRCPQTARSSLIPERFEQDLLQLDGEHQGLVHLPSALVGPPHPGLLLRRLRRGDCRQGSTRPSARSAAAPTCTRTRTRWTPGSARRCGRSPRWAGRIRPRSWNTSIPTNTLVTGYDIIFFWVARMIFSGLEHMGEIPFDTVLYPRPGPRRAGPKDEQVAGQRHRPAGDHRPVRRRRAALYPGHRQQPRATTCASATRRSSPAATLPTRCGTLPALS